MHLKENWNLITITRCLFFLSAAPFCWGVSTQYECWVIPSFWRYLMRVLSKYCFPLSECNVWILELNWFHTILWKRGNIYLTFDFVFEDIYPCRSYSIIYKSNKLSCTWYVNYTRKAPNLRLKGMLCLLLLRGKGPMAMFCKFTNFKIQVMYICLTKLGKNVFEWVNWGDPIFYAKARFDIYSHESWRTLGEPILLSFIDGWRR